MLVMLGPVAFSAETYIIHIVPKHTGENKDNMSKIVPGLVITYYDEVKGIETLSVTFPEESAKGLVKIMKGFIAQYNRKRKMLLDTSDARSQEPIPPPLVY